jgi:hypothetical protein
MNRMKPFRHWINLIAGGLALLLGMDGLVEKLCPPAVAWAVICVGVFLISRTIYRIYQVNKIIRAASFLWLLPAVYLVYSFFAEATFCTPSQKVALIVANVGGGGSDSIVHPLRDQLAAGCHGIDSVEVLLWNDKTIIPRRNDREDSLYLMFAEKCFDHGLLVYGSRNPSSNLLDCTIFVNNLDNLVAVVGSNRIGFSIDPQPAVLAEFMLGLVYYHLKRFAAAKEKFNHCLALNRDNRNLTFVSLCQVFLKQVNRPGLL